MIESEIDSVPLQVSHTSTSLSLSDAAHYPSLYRAIPTDFPAIQASIALLKMLKWSRVAIIGEKSASGLVCIITIVTPLGSYTISWLKIQNPSHF